MTTSDELAPFCHDHIQHPLFWCDEKKRLVERKNAEESMRMWRRRKAEELARKEKEKQEYYELFLKHCPWGRPGGGAPNEDIRRKDITAIGLHSTPTVDISQRLSSLQHCRYGDYFTHHKKCCVPPLGAFNHNHNHHQQKQQHQQQHHHHLTMPPQAPPAAKVTHTHTVHKISDITRPGASSTVTVCEREVSGANQPTLTKTTNGDSLQITLKDHPAMSFRNKGHVDIEVRYKPTQHNKGKPLLEKIVVTETDKSPGLQCTPAQTSKKSTPKKSFCAKMEKLPSKDPWGRIGPGGKPWRSPKAVGSTFMKSLGWTNKELLKDLDQDNPVTPAEKPLLRKSRATKKMTRCCDLCTCNCPAMAANSPLKPLQLKPLNSVSPKRDNPLMNKQPETIKRKICPRLLRRSMAGAARKFCGISAERNQSTTDNSACVRIGPGGGGGGPCAAAERRLDNEDTGNGNGVELVPLLARRRATNRPISLSSTDITKRTASHDRLPTAADIRYLHDLNEQISEKRLTISITQQLERDLCNKHFETFETFWGRPGNGAPTVNKNKLKLDNLLYGVQGCSD